MSPPYRSERESHMAKSKNTQQGQGAITTQVPPQRAPPGWEGGCSVANPGSRGAGHLHGASGGARGRGWEVSVPPGGGGAGNGSSWPGRPGGPSRRAPPVDAVTIQPPESGGSWRGPRVTTDTYCDFWR